MPSALGGPEPSGDCPPETDSVAGVLYGLSATLMKPVVENLHAEGLVDVLGGWEFWVWAAAGIIGFLVQQLSLSTGRLVPSVAAVSVANPVVSMMLGALVLQERFDKTPPWHAVLGVGGLAWRSSAQS